jgi:hypothetical protein
MSDVHDKRIKALLEAAFRELQHDTGETNPEYRHAHKVLENKFRKILRYPAKNNRKP